MKADLIAAGPAAIQNQRQRSLRVDALDQDAVLEGDGAVHAPFGGEFDVQDGSAQVAKPGVPVVTTHPGGVLVRITYCLCFTYSSNGPEIRMISRTG